MNTTHVCAHLQTCADVQPPNNNTPHTEPHSTHPQAAIPFIVTTYISVVSKLVFASRREVQTNAKAKGQERPSHSECPNTT